VLSASANHRNPEKREAVMNTIFSYAKKGFVVALFTVLATGLSGCAPVLGLAAVGAGASLLALDDYTSTADTQPAQDSERQSSAR